MKHFLLFFIVVLLWNIPINAQNQAPGQNQIKVVFNLMPGANLENAQLRLEINKLNYSYHYHHFLDYINEVHPVTIYPLGEYVKVLECTAVISGPHANGRGYGFDSNPWNQYGVDLTIFVDVFPDPVQNPDE